MKKIISVLLVFLMFLVMVPVQAESETTITVYLSVSRYGEFVTDVNGGEMVYVPIELSGQASYTIDDVFIRAHELYYPEGVEGYATSYSEDWGLGVAKLWGDTSYNFGYQVNGGRESVMGPDHEVEDEDVVDACIYKNFYPEIEKYTSFESLVEETCVDETVDLTLSYVSGYDESGNNVFSPCEGATIWVDGEETQTVTDENGEAHLTFDETGTYIISAKKTKVLNEATVPAITAPICVVTVNPEPAVQIVHNIAKAYQWSDFDGLGVNLPWIVADMIIYEELFPDSEYCLTEERKEEAKKALVSFASTATRPGDLAKSILALRALGYDASKIYTENFEKVNLVAKLTALVDSGDEAVTNVFTLPYVILALSQAEGYASNSQIETLLQAALTSKATWQNTAEGTDALTPMLLALAPFSDMNAVLEETVEILRGEQREDGLIDGFPGYESASTGLAICGLSAVGVDASEVINGENSLIDGLLSVANEDLGGFPNAFATEQGFRGLLAWCLLRENTGKTMYDFSDSPMAEANVPGAVACPVVFSVSPANAVVTIEGEEAISSNIFDLAEGEYSYTVSAARYESQTGTITVTAEEEASRNAKTETVVLNRIFVSGGGGSVSGTTEEKEEVEEKTEEKTEETTEPEATLPVETVFADVHQDDWYYPAVTFAYQNKLIQGTDVGFEPEMSMTRGMLVTVLHRLASPEALSSASPFSDVPEGAWYSEAVNWAVENNVVFGVSDSQFDPNASITREQLAVILYRYAVLCGYDVSQGKTDLPHEDSGTISSYAAEAMQYAVGAGIITGNTDNTLAPGKTATRAEVATMLMRFVQGA